jgi:hypothetical protein
MIRQAVTRDNNDDYSSIQTAFCGRTFASLLKLVEIIQHLPEASIDNVLLNSLKENKN